MESLEIAPFDIGMQFEYVGDPSSDHLRSVIEKGATGTLVRPYGGSLRDGGKRWFVKFDAGPLLIWSGFRNEDFWVSEANIRPLPSAEGRCLDETEATALAQAIDRAEKAEAALDELRKTVARVARQKAAEHDWCGVVEEALGEMGIPYEVTSLVTVRIATHTYVSHMSDAALTLEDVRCHMDGWAVPGHCIEGFEVHADEDEEA